MAAAPTSSPDTPTLAGTVSGEPPIPGWMGLLRPGVRVTAAALFPTNDKGAPDWRQTDLVERCLSYISILPPMPRTLLALLFLSVHLLPLMRGIPLPLGFLTPTQRAWVVRRLRNSRFILVRMMGDSVKATLTMVYMSHPAVDQFMGAFRSCDHDADPVRFDVRHGVLETISRPRGELTP